MGSVVVDAAHLAVPGLAAVLVLPEIVLELPIVTLVVVKCSSSKVPEHGEVHLLAAYHKFWRLAV